MPPVNTVSVFPIEIFEHVIDQSDDLDGSLSSLSLSCRTFLPRARLNLFSHIHIGHREKLESAPAFLQARPWLPPIARRLTIRDYVRRDSFMLLTVVPARLLAMLPNLCSLEFATDEHGGARGRGPEWQRYAIAYKHPVASILHKSCTRIQRLELTHLRFRTVGDLVELLCALPNLKNLACMGTFCVPMAARPSWGLEGYSRITKGRHIRLTQLATDADLNVEALGLLLERSRDTLENLTMAAVQYSWKESTDAPGYSTGYDRIETPLAATALSQLSQLQTLTLDITRTATREQRFPPLELITQILNSLMTRETQVLKCLKVIWPAEALTLLAFDVGDTRLTPLVKALEQSIIRLPLNEVIFSAACCRKNRRVFAASALYRSFPSIKQRGIFKVTDVPLHPSNIRTRVSEIAVGHDAGVSSLIASPDGRLFASSSFDGTIILWDACQGTIVHEWAPHSGRRVHSLVFSPDSCRLLSCGAYPPLKVWDLSEDARQVYSLELRREEDGLKETTSTDDLGAPAEADWHECCAWSPDGAWIASASRDRHSGRTRMVHLWQRVHAHGEGRPSSGFHLHRSFDGLATPPRFRGPAVCFSPDGRWLVWPAEVAGLAHVAVWDAREADAPPRTFPLLYGDDRSPAYQCTPSFDPTSARLLAVHGSCLRLWDMANGEPLAIMEEHTAYVTSGCFSPDGRTVLSASEDGTAKVWDADSGRCVLTLDGLGKEAVQASYSPNGQHIVAVSRDMIRLWETRGRSSLVASTEPGVPSPLSHVVFSPGGKTLAAADADGVVRVYDVSHVIGH